MSSGATEDEPYQVVYFGFGSNLWRWQMHQRCPDSAFLGVGRLDGWRWIINQRGYANVVETVAGKETTLVSITADRSGGILHKDPFSDENSVYGLVYALSKTDEQRLDRNEAVPFAYAKEIHDVLFWPSPGENKPVDLRSPSEQVPMLVYVDRKRVTEASPTDEYLYRMNRGVDDAIKEGVPRAWIDRVIRKFIPEIKNETADVENRDRATEQALDFEDEQLERNPLRRTDDTAWGKHRDMTVDS